MMRSVWGAIGIVALAASAGHAQTVNVTVSAPADRDYADAPVSVVVPAARLLTKKAIPPGATPCQAEPAGPGQVRLTWIVANLAKGQSRRYTLLPSRTNAVELKKNGGNVDFLVNGGLFTRYDTTTGPNKPYFFPIIGPTGKPIVRRGPVEKVDGETTDHPHHRGLWFTFEKMNGVDFWTEGAKTGKSVNTGFDAIESGPIYGRLRARTDWIKPDGTKIAEDTREAVVTPVANGTFLDLTIAIKAVGGPLLWGDAKDGLLGIRVPDSMRADAGKGQKSEGRIENARGLTQDAAWGKPAEWCDYVGPVDGETVGIAIFDHPENPRHPTPWHVRAYGLMAANPFGLHQFDPKNSPDPKAGDFTTPEGQTTTFRYRLFFHKGDTKAARIRDVWAAYATPPKIEVNP